MNSPLTRSRPKRKHFTQDVLLKVYASDQNN
jgi:hypothetical protein